MAPTSLRLTVSTGADLHMVGAILVGADPGGQI